MNEQNKLSGKELKRLMTDGKLPDEYICEENIKALLDYEFEQMGDLDEYYDMSVVQYCNDLLNKNYTDENYEKQKNETLKKIKAQIQSMDKIENSKNFITTKRRMPTKKRFRFLYIAISIVVMIFCVQVVSITAFSFNLFDWTKEQFLTLLGIEERRDDTSYLASHSRRYNTVEELEKAENIDIVVPTWLPSNIEIKKISYSFDYGKKQIDISYNDNLTGLSIKLDSQIPDTNGTRIYENNNALYYIFIESNVILWEYDGNFYNLACGFDVVEYAEKIIENIK